MLTLVVGAWGAPAAHAACSNTAAREQAELATVILTGVVESGPTSPAWVRVETWEKGSGPAVVEVDTGVYEDYALAEGLALRPGERWRLYGALEHGELITDACWGSHVLPARAVAPDVRTAPLRRHGRVLGTAQVRTVAATFGGRALTAAALPVLTVPRRTPLRLRFSGRVADARLVGAPRGARLVHGRKGWTLRLPARARRAGRLVVDTRDGFFAALVRPV